VAKSATNRSKERAGRPRISLTSSVTHAASPRTIRLNAWAFISAMPAGMPARIIASRSSSNELVQAVIDYQADAIIGTQRQADLGTVEGLTAWRDMVIAAARGTDGMGGCPLGSLGGQLAESDPRARERIAGGFERWSAAISDGLRALHAAGRLPDDVDPDDIATALLAVMQGGLLLAQVQRSSRPLEIAVDTLLALALRPSTASAF
jgi:AcrR family transcriptional regulator